MALNIAGLIMMVVFYLLVLGTGIWASVKAKVKVKNTNSSRVEVSFLANRSVSLVLGVFTMTGSIVVAGLVGTSLTYLDGGILVFWILGSDLTYTIVFPQLICVLFIKVSNGYGAITGFLVAVVTRLLCGEPLLSLPVILHFPGCTLEDGVYIQRSPVKTICMLCALVSILMSSYVASLFFNRGILPKRMDVFKVKSQGALTSADGARQGDSDENDENDTFV